MSFLEFERTDHTVHILLSDTSSEEALVHKCHYPDPLKYFYAEKILSVLDETVWPCIVHNVINTMYCSPHVHCTCTLLMYSVHERVTQA